MQGPIGTNKVSKHLWTKCNLHGGWIYVVHCFIPGILRIAWCIVDTPDVKNCWSLCKVLREKKMCVGSTSKELVLCLERPNGCGKSEGQVKKAITLKVAMKVEMTCVLLKFLSERWCSSISIPKHALFNACWPLFGHYLHFFTWEFLWLLEPAQARRIRKLRPLWV